MTAKPFNVLLQTSDYRGDHSADVAIAIEPLPNETVAELVARSLTSAMDRLEIRLMRQPEPDPEDINF